MTFPEKLQTLLANYEWSQKRLAESLGYAPSSINKWLNGGIMPPVATLKRICELFSYPLADLLDDSVDVPEFFVIDQYLPYSQLEKPECRRDSEHTIIDAALAGEARLHRFLNHGGFPCSAIYLANREIWWHYRDHEPKMIYDWNREYSYDR